MKPTKLFLALAVAVLLGACGYKENAYWLAYRSHDIKLMDDVQIAVADSFVVLVSAFFEDGVCHTYSIADNLEFCHAYGRIGSGVDEYRQPVLTFASGNTFGINDINEMSLTVIGIDSDGAMNAKKRIKPSSGYSGEEERNQSVHAPLRLHQRKKEPASRSYPTFGNERRSQ